MFLLLNQMMRKMFPITPAIPIKTFKHEKFTLQAWAKKKFNSSGNFICSLGEASLKKRGEFGKNSQLDEIVSAMASRWGIYSFLREKIALEIFS